MLRVPPLLPQVLSQAFVIFLTPVRGSVGLCSLALEEELHPQVDEVIVREESQGEGLFTQKELQPQLQGKVRDQGVKERRAHPGIPLAQVQ